MVHAAFLNFFFSLIIAWNWFWQFFLFLPFFGLKQSDFRKKSGFLLSGQGGKVLYKWNWANKLIGGLKTWMGRGRGGGNYYWRIKATFGFLSAYSLITEAVKKQRKKHRYVRMPIQKYFWILKHMSPPPLYVYAR